MHPPINLHLILRPQPARHQRAKIGTLPIPFRRRAWKEEVERSERYRTRYGSQSAWAAFFARLAEREVEAKTALGISDEEVKKLKRWPTLGTMVSDDPKTRDRIKDDGRRSYLTFLHDWFYHDFSSDTHLSPPGFWRRAEFLIKESRLWDEDQRTALAIFRTNVFVAAVGLVLATAAELEHELQFGMRERVVRIWSRLNHSSPPLEDLYDQRARSLLSAQIPPV